MGFKHIVVLGGGPIGLLAAIEAKKHFHKVTIVEKRGQYSRTNVPVLGDNLRAHLADLGVAKKIGVEGANSAAPISRIEEALWAKAQSRGVTMMRGRVAVAVHGQDVKADMTFKSMALTIREWDDRAKALAPSGSVESLKADLLIVSTGGGASGDDPVMAALQFHWRELKAKNYGAFGIFDATHLDYGPPGNKAGQPVQDQARRLDLWPIVSPIATGRTPIHTRDHNYLLLTLGGCTKAEFKLLQQNAARLRTLLLSTGATLSSVVLTDIKAVTKNVALFKISVKKANQFYSPRYPAVLIGDAAVTPHPEEGSGLVTGFKGIEELQKLLLALKATHRSEDYRKYFLDFDSSFHVFVAEKALKGTLSILVNLLNTTVRVKGDLASALSGIDHRGAKRVVADMEAAFDQLIADFKAEVKDTETLLSHFGPNPRTPEPGLSIDRLWARIADTYRELKILTSDVDFLSERLDQMETRLSQ